MVRKVVIYTSSLAFAQTVFSFQHEDAVKVLTNDSQTHWKQQLPALERYLRDNPHLTFRKIAIKHKDLSHLPFNHALFEDCLLEDITFSKSAPNMQFRYCQLNKVIFRDHTLRGTQFIKSYLFGCDFYNTDLTRALFEDSEVSYSRFRGTSPPLQEEPDSFFKSAVGYIEKATGYSPKPVPPAIPKAHFKRVKFDGTVFQHMDLSHTSLRNLYFRGCKFDDVDFRNSDFRNSLIACTKINDAVKLSGIKLYNKQDLIHNMAPLDLVCEYNKSVLANQTFKTRGLNNLFALTKLDLSRLPLVGLNLSRIQLIDGNLKHAYLTGANFQSAIIYDTNFEEAELEKVNFQGATFNYSSGSNSTLVSFKDAKLKEASFEGATLNHQVSFEGAELDRVKWDEVKIKNALALEKTILEQSINAALKEYYGNRGVYFVNLINEYNDCLRHGNQARAEEINKILAFLSYQQPEIRGANFAGFNLSGLKIHNAQFTDVNLQGANLRGAQLSDSHFVKTNFKGTDLRETNLTGSKFKEGVNLEGAVLAEGLELKGNESHKELVKEYSKSIQKTKNLSLSPEARVKAKTKADGLNRLFTLLSLQLHKANFREFDLSGIKLEGADLRGAILEKANLMGAVLTNVNLEKALLTQANVSKAYLEKVNFKGAHLEEANLEQTRFSSCDLQEINLTGVSLKKVGMDLKDLLKLELAPDQRADLSPWNYFVFNFEEEIIPEEVQAKEKIDEDGFMLLENLK